MKTPIIWMAAGAATGAMYWSHIGPALCEAVAFTVTMLMTLLRCPTHRRQWILMMVGFGLPGINMPHSMGSTTEEHLVGSVIERQKYNAVLKTKRGLVSTRMDAPPPVGTTITARVQTDSYRSSFPGEYASTNIKRRLGIPAVRAISFAPINTVEQTVEIIPAHHAGVIHALATGNRAYVDSSVIETMRRSGTIHLLAISGLHIGMAATIGWMLGWLVSRPIIGWPQFARLIPTLMAISSAGFYANVVGWPTSTQRAFWMVLVFSVS